MMISNRPLRILTALFLFTAFITIPLHADAGVKTKAKQCKKVQSKITDIQKKMRSGYSVKQGVKYHKKLNKLYKEEFKYCI